MASEPSPQAAALADGSSGQPAPLGAPPVPAEVLLVPEGGLEPMPGVRRRVVVMGAGIAGLVAAFELSAPGSRARSCWRRSTGSADA